LLSVDYTVLGLTLGFLEVLFSSNNVKFTLKEWMLLAPKTIPSQQDSSSCGVFACMNAYLLACGKTDCFYNSEDVDDIRHWMVHRLITKASRNHVPRQELRELRVETSSINNVLVNPTDVNRSIPDHDCSNLESVFMSIRRLADQRKKDVDDFHPELTPDASFEKSLNQGIYIYIYIYTVFSALCHACQFCQTVECVKFAWKLPFL
jgi:hypothetical protein